MAIAGQSHLPASGYSFLRLCNGRDGEDRRVIDRVLHYGHEGVISHVRWI